MRLLPHWYYMIRATVWLLLAFGRARWYFHHRAIQDLQLPHPETLTSSEKRRLQHYFYGGTYLSIIACTLRGRTRSAAEKNRLTNLAALAYFFDDLVDEFRERDDTGILWQDNPEEYGLAADDERQLALHFLHNLYEGLPPGHIPAFKSSMYQVFNIEASGRQAGNTPVDLSELQHITGGKGGFSVLLFRLALEPLPDKQEEAALLSFGHLIQLCDDIFDLWFDLQSNTMTLATYCVHQHKLGLLRQVFEQQVANCRAAFRKTSAPVRRAETSLRVIHYLVAITRVCLVHYDKCQQSTGSLLQCSRKELVVDMERWSNRFRAAFILAFQVR